MRRFREHLPQLEGDLFLTDGGVETTLVFHDGFDLPHFAAFDLLRRADGEAALRRYFRSYAALARRLRTGLVLESPTWRANADWGARLGYVLHDLDRANRRAIRILEELRLDLDGEVGPVVLSGCVGPRGDGYLPADTMGAALAEAYHRAQIETFADTGADMVTAMTMSTVAEAIGVARAAAGCGMPSAISFTVETDGRLPDGTTLAAAVRAVDDATDRAGAAPAYYMINCAHPSHFASRLDAGADWTRRIRGLRANASRRSHAELDGATDLDAGNPAELGREHAELVARIPWINVLGGCCGTDARHVGAIAEACLALRGRSAA
jgi:S-methylmethionine-dependent homocysteine/selenocysteine methylase